MSQTASAAEETVLESRCPTTVEMESSDDSWEMTFSHRLSSTANNTRAPGGWCRTR